MDPQTAIALAHLHELLPLAARQAALWIVERAQHFAGGHIPQKKVLAGQGQRLAIRTKAQRIHSISKEPLLIQLALQCPMQGSAGRLDESFRC